MSRNDPIRGRYFRAVERAETANEALFFLGALLSFATLLVDKEDYPNLFEWTLWAFLVVTISMFAIGLCSRLYWIPRAEKKRREDFFTSACSVGLTHAPTDGYYNNGYTDSIYRMAAQVFENSHFSKAIALRMSHFERAKFSLYAIFWFVCLLNRETDLGWAVAATQAIFSEQLLSKVIRLEWLRIQFENTHKEMHRLFQSQPKGAEFTAMMLDTLTSYETAKATGGIVLSAKLFDRLNLELSREWDKVKETLRMQH